MRKILPTLLLSSVLVVFLVITVSGQDSSPLAARITPLLAHVQQRIPVSITMQIPLGVSETQTVTVPMELDLNLEIGFTSLMTPHVQVASTAPARVTVSQLHEAGELLIDNSDIPYSIENTDGVEIIQVTSGEDGLGDFDLIGELRNTSEERALDSVQLIVSFYDTEGNLLDLSTTYASINTIPPGGTSPFQFLITQDYEDVARYKIQIDARFER